MNKVFKSVWSEALGAWVAASELCRGRGKGGGKAARAVALVVGLSAAGGAFAVGPGTELSNALGQNPGSTGNATDIAIGPMRDGALIEGVPGPGAISVALSGGAKPLYRVVKIQRLGALSFRTFIDHWRKEGLLLAQLLWGTLALNLFALVIPLYMNAIYRRVIPAQADASLWVLSIGTLLAFGLEYLFRVERAKVMVGLSRSVRGNIEPQIVDQLVRAPLSRATDWGTATLNGLTGWSKARSLFWSLAASSVIDIFFLRAVFHRDRDRGGLARAGPVRHLDNRVCCGVALQQVPA